jgi:predicted dehydrogenase
MADTIRWGIISTGNIAAQFARDLRVADHAELRGVASRSLETARRFAEEHSVPKAYGSYEELAAAPDIDAVYIGTPHACHKDNTLLCLKHGKHVLCEKPLALDQGEALEMVQAAHDAGRFLMEAMWMLFFPAVQKARDLVREGAIGELRMLRADFAFKADLEPEGRLLNPALGGGALLDIGIYPLALAQLIFGEAPIAIATAAELGETGVDMQSGIVMKYASGACAALSCSFETAMPQEAVIAGTTGTILIPAEFSHPDALVLRRNGSEERITFERRGIGYYWEVEEAGRCIREGLLESPVVPHDESLALARTMDRVRRVWSLKYPGER